MKPLGTPNNSFSQHVFQGHTIYLGETNVTSAKRESRLTLDQLVWMAGRMVL